MENKTPNTNQEGGPPVETPSPEAPVTEPEKKSAGPLVGIIIIVVLIVLAGFYFWGSLLGDRNMTAEEIASEPDSALVELEEQSASDEVIDIEIDLDSTQLDDLDKELGDIDLELEF